MRANANATVFARGPLPSKHHVERKAIFVYVTIYDILTLPSSYPYKRAHIANQGRTITSWKIFNILYWCI